MMAKDILSFHTNQIIMGLISQIINWRVAEAAKNSPFG